MQKFRVSSALIAAFASACLPFVSGCGGDDDFFDFFTPAQVTDVRVDPASVRVGEQIAIQVDFDPSQFDSDDLEPSTVVLRLPVGVNYVNGSSEFDGSDVSGFRSRGPNRIDGCGDGTTVLSYFFDAGEQTDFENKIRLAAVATTAAVGEVLFEAEADSGIATPCGIFRQDSDNLIVLP